MTNIIYQESNSTYPGLQQQPIQPIYQQPQTSQQFYYAPSTPLIQKPITVQCEEDKYRSDNSYSVTFLVLGIFLFFPLFFNYKYLKSPHCYARKIALASLIIGSVYLATIFITYSVFYFTSLSYNQCWNGSYYYNC